MAQALGLGLRRDLHRQHAREATTEAACLRKRSLSSQAARAGTPWQAGAKGCMRSDVETHMCRYR